MSDKISFESFEKGILQLKNDYVKTKQFENSIFGLSRNEKFRNICRELNKLVCEGKTDIIEKYEQRILEEKCPYVSLMFLKYFDYTNHQEENIKIILSAFSNKANKKFMYYAIKELSNYQSELHNKCHDLKRDINWYDDKENANARIKIFEKNDIPSKKYSKIDAYMNKMLVKCMSFNELLDYISKMYSFENVLTKEQAITILNKVFETKKFDKIEKVKNLGESNLVKNEFDYNAKYKELVLEKEDVMEGLKFLKSTKTEFVFARQVMNIIKEKKDYKSCVYIMKNYSWEFPYYKHNDVLKLIVEIAPQDELQSIMTEIYDKSSDAYSLGASLQEDYDNGYFG